MKDLELIKEIVRAERAENIPAVEAAVDALWAAYNAGLRSVREQFELGSLT